MAHILASCNDTKNDLLKKIVNVVRQPVAPERADLIPLCNDSNRDLYAKLLTIVNIIAVAFGNPEDL